MGGIKKAFTLIELVVVISIMGVLMSFVLPSISGVMEKSRRSNALNCMKQIANAYVMYRQSNGDVSTDILNTTPGWDGNNWLVGFSLLMAREGFLNDPSCYLFSSDSYGKSMNSIKKNTIVEADGQTFSDCWKAREDAKFSVAIVINLSGTEQEDTTPIAFTRGLTTGGTWNEDTGVFGNKGGYVAFLNGKVKWFDNLSNALLKSDMKAQTSNLKEAIPSSATIIGANTLN